MTARVSRVSVPSALGGIYERVRILEAAPPPLNLFLAAGQAYTIFDSAGDPILRVTEGGATELFITSASTFTVFDSVNNPVFRIDDDGSLHGKTGEALTFDL